MELTYRCAVCRGPSKTSQGCIFCHIWANLYKRHINNPENEKLKSTFHSFMCALRKRTRRIGAT